ncbi:hypothetical protein [Streptomyces sp. NPDC049949]|uniref:hypothetical protein n=1 Tax=Streptomyces sp. NPDC049949 TaxID=3154627 RepID=UPI0034499E39
MELTQPPWCLRRKHPVLKPDGAPWSVDAQQEPTPSLPLPAVAHWASVPLGREGLVFDRLFQVGGELQQRHALGYPATGFAEGSGDGPLRAVHSDEPLKRPGFVQGIEVLMLDCGDERGLKQCVGVFGKGVVEVGSKAPTLRDLPKTRWTTSWTSWMS